VGDESSPNSPVPQQPSKAGQGDRDSTPELSTESVSNDVSASQDSQSVDGDPVVAVGQHLIKFSYQDGYQRSKYITVTDAVELAKQYSSSPKDHKFLSALREESNSNGDLAVSKSSADRFLKLLKGHLKKNNDPQSDRLSLMRAGGKGPFHLVMN
jgi:hypothetical protein